MTGTTLSNLKLRFVWEFSQTEDTKSEVFKSLHIDEKIREGTLKEVYSHYANGIHTIRYQSYIESIPVLGSSLVVRVNDKGEVLALYSTIPDFNSKSANININSEQALLKAYEVIGKKSLRADPATELAVQIIGGETVYCWRVQVPSAVPLGDWEILIRSDTGEVLVIENFLQRFDCIGAVFNPDPVTSLRDSTLRDSQDSSHAIPQGAYLEVDLLDVSRNEQGFYHLTGQWVDTAPSQTRAFVQQSEFIFNREDDRFEEVMAYYHIDHQARYIRSLGYQELPLSPQLVNVNGIAEDMSFFSPMTRVITFGIGGVDDAEDADVILHEYTHSILHQIQPFWRGGETALLTEGLCDYFAGDWSLAVEPDFQPYSLYNWDGHNQFWSGRILNSDMTYPETANRERHQAGQMWSSLLTEIRQASGERDLWNKVVLDHVFSLGDSALVSDAARALLNSDMALASGYFRRLIVEGCEKRQIRIPGLYKPDIAHEPLSDTEDLSRRRVTVSIVGETPVDPSRVLLIYRFNNGKNDTLIMRSRFQIEREYRAYIPELDEPTLVQYYFCAVDSYGVMTTFPNDAQFFWFEYFAGRDVVEPEIMNILPLKNTVFPAGNINIGIEVSDNIGIGSVTAFWFENGQPIPDSIQLFPDLTNRGLYSNKLTWRSNFNTTIQVFYRVSDIAEHENTVFSDMTSFDIASSAIIDDFEDGTIRWHLNVWTLSDVDPQNGEYCLSDRNPLILGRPDTTYAYLFEDWDFSFCDQAHLVFYERHEFDNAHGEFGTLEFSSDSGNTWRQQIDFRGSQPWWGRREIDLREFCAGRTPPVRVRWKTISPANSINRGGWFIDNVSLVTGQIVSANEIPKPAVPPSFYEPFPNPANGEFSINYQIHQPGTLELIDISGRSIKSFNLVPGKQTFGINMKSKPTGIYWLRLTSGEDVIIRKIVILN